MRRRWILIASLFFCCCGKPNHFIDIKPGMRSSEVIDLLGKPEKRQPMGSAEWWLYADSAKHLVIINQDTVTKLTTQDEAMKVMERNLKAIDSLNGR